MANENTLANVLSVECKEYYEKAFMEELQDQLVLYKLAKKTTLPKNNGTTMTWRMFKDLTPNTNTSKEGGMSPLGEIPNVTPNKLSIVQFTCALKKYGDHILITEDVNLKAIDPIMSEATKLLGREAGLVFDTKVMDGMLAGTSVYYANGAATRAATTSTITIADLVKIKAMFKKRNVKPHTDGKYIAIISPEVEMDLKLLTASNASWIDVAKYADPSKAYEGEIGDFMGFRWIVTNSVQSVSNGASSAVNLHQCVFLGDEAIGVVNLAGESNAPSIIFHGAGSSGINDVYNEINSLAWINRGFCTRILRDEALIRYEVKPSVELSVAITDADRSGYDKAVTGY